jgi:ubiquinone biosynthesis protein UbiJ
MTETSGGAVPQPSIGERLQASGKRLAEIKNNLDWQAAKRAGEKEEAKSPKDRMADLREQVAQLGKNGKQLLERIRRGGTKPLENTPENPDST